VSDTAVSKVHELIANNLTRICLHHCRPGANAGALSPMHIPDEEEAEHHEYSSSQEMLGLARSHSSPP
jgi:hypothetical protein